MSDTSFVRFSGKGIPEEFESLEGLLGKPGRKGFLWIDIDDPDEAEFRAVSERLGVHHLAVDDCLDANRVPKIEDYSNHALLLINRFTAQGDRVGISEFDFIFNEGFLISVHGLKASDHEYTNRLRKAALRPMNGRPFTPDILLHTLIDFIVDDKLSAIEILQDDIDKLEERILECPETFDPREFSQFRGMLLDLSRSLSHEREALGIVLNKEAPFVSEASTLYFRDVYDHLSRYLDQVEKAREAIRSHSELYFSAMNNRMGKASMATNRTMRRLTMITTIFMPLSLLAGIGGMSEWTMMTGQENWRFVYPLSLAGLALIGFISFLILRHRGKDE